MDHASRQQLHKQKWLHNRTFITTIDGRYCDWIVTVAFYSALHCFEMLSSYDNNNPHEGHKERNQTMKTTKRYGHIFRNYHPLFNAAIDVRYYTDSGKWIPENVAKEKFVSHYLWQVECSVMRLIGLPSPQPLVLTPAATSSKT